MVEYIETLYHLCDMGGDGSTFLCGRLMNEAPDFCEHCKRDYETKKSKVMHSFLPVLDDHSTGKNICKKCEKLATTKLKKAIICRDVNRYLDSMADCYGERLVKFAAKDWVTE